MPLALDCGDLVADALAGDLALELRERQQDVQGQPAHAAGALSKQMHQASELRAAPLTAPAMSRPRKPANPFRYFNSSPEVIRLVVMMYVRYPLSLRNVEDLLFERGVDLCHETVRLWWNSFGPLFAGDIRRQRVQRMRAFTHWKWHLDEVYVKMNGELHYLWRAVDHEGEVLESFVTKTRDKAAALKFIKKALKRHGKPEAIVTDGLRSYGAAMNELGNQDRQEGGRWLNNRVENSATSRSDDESGRWSGSGRMKTLQKFSSVHASVHNLFNQERHLIDAETSTRNDAPPPWPSGRSLWPKATLLRRQLRQMETSCDWTDSTRLRLVKLAEPIFAALASGQITLDLAKAYASTESHDKQLLCGASMGIAVTPPPIRSGAALPTRR